MSDRGNAAVGLLEDFSLEMTGKDLEALAAAGRVIPQGTRINVTFLGNEDLDTRCAAAEAITQAGFVPVPHISARRLHSEVELRTFLERLRAIGATEKVFIIGGDPATPAGPYADSLSVIASGILPEYGVREVGVAGYPEGHPDIGADVLWAALEGKIAAIESQGLTASITTQFAFDTDAVLTWITSVRGRDITAPIRIGTPGPAGIKRLLGFARRFGIGANATIVKKYGFSLTNLLGSAGPDRFVTATADALAEHDQSAAVGLHFYTFGGLQATASWVEAFTANPEMERR